MGRLKFALVIVVITAVVLLLVFYLVGYFKPTKAGLNIETNPQSSVYIDGVQAGRTPFDMTRAQGEIVIKLIPDSFDKPLVPFESKITLVSGVKTIIRRSFAESNEASSGTIISFEKVGGSDTGISIISSPDSCQVKIDGQVKGFTPYKSSSIGIGDHTIALSADKFKEESIDLRTYQGYKLIAEFKLASTNETPEPSPTPETQTKVLKLKILTTPTGFLRVRDEPSTSAKEIGQIKPGEIFEMLEEDKETGWYKIEYLPAQAGQKGKEGWISDQYIEKIEDVAEASPTPTAKS